MKKIIISLLVIVALGLSINAYSQGKAFIKFEKTVHDYGQMKEADGPAKCVFNFVNTGTEALVITKVKPNCGCTTPEWTKQPIPPNGKGYISAIYDPKNRPGSFNKTIRVTTNADNSNVILRIKGDVLAKKKGVNDLYPYEMKNIRLNTNHLAFQNITSNQIKIDTIKIVSVAEENIAISFERVPDHMAIKAIPATLKPKKEGLIIVTYDAGLKNDWGFVIDRVPVVFNGSYDRKDRKSRVTISANIQEDFSKLSEAKKAKAAKIEFESKVFNFGTINQGESIDYVFKFKNTGKSDLIIRKTKASCGCTIVNPEDKVIKPGASSSFAVKFNSRGKKGKQNKTITVITNDPENPSLILKVTGLVKVPEKK